MKKIKSLIVFLVVILTFCSCSSLKSDEQTTKKALSTSNNEQIEYIPKYSVDGNKISFSDFYYQLPENFTLLENTAKPTAETNDGKMQFMVEDLSEKSIELEQYAEETFESYRAMGMNPTAIENVEISGFSAKKFVVNTFDGVNLNVSLLFYFVNSNDVKTLVTVMLKDENEINAAGIDEFVSNIRFEKV